MDTSGNIRKLTREAPLRSDETLLTSRVAKRLLKLPQTERVEAHRQQAAARAGTSHLWRCDQRNAEGHRCRNHVKPEGKHSAFGKVW
jgi:hypothetical protein